MSDWLYSEERLNLRAKCLGRLLHKYGWELDELGLPKYPMEQIHSCAHDWVSQGNETDAGILNYFENYYRG
jgi:hypothetical protein